MTAENWTTAAQVGFFVIICIIGYLVTGFLTRRKNLKPTSVDSIAKAQQAFVAACEAVEDINLGIANSQVEVCRLCLDSANESHYKDDLRRRIDILEGQIKAMADGAVEGGDKYCRKTPLLSP